MAFRDSSITMADTVVFRGGHLRRICLGGREGVDLRVLGTNNIEYWSLFFLEPSCGRLLANDCAGAWFLSSLPG